MHQMTYQDAWSFLDRLQFFKIKLGLDSMNLFLDALGNPQQGFPCIHIGGTNGKGSVGAALHSILDAAGYRVGFYTSPHLSCVRERFRIGAEFIPEDDFTRQACKIVGILAGRQITYFEFTTALALLWFAERQADLAILEVGMGGRLDATNVVIPLVSVITNVAMDHELYLGHSIREIAAEKAGIIKPGVPVVTGADDEAALEVITAAAAEKNSPLYLLHRDFSGSRSRADGALWSYGGIGNQNGKPRVRYADLPLRIRGEHQVDNAALALATLEVMAERIAVGEKHIRLGLDRMQWPGRLEEFLTGGDRPVRILLDGAHNPDGAKTLRKSLEQDFRYDRLLLIWASMGDKDISGTLLEVAPLADRIIFTRPESERSALPEDMILLLPEEARSSAYCATNAVEALVLAMNMAGPADLVCIAGSLYLVGRARQLLRGELVEGT